LDRDVPPIGYPLRSMVSVIMHWILARASLWSCAAVKDKPPADLQKGGR
jgi:hypothetical protein